MGQKNWIAIITILVLMVVIGISLFFMFADNEKENNNGYEIPDPSITYCEDAGYDYKIKNTDEGEQGFCVFPDKTECDSWSYFCGCTDDKRYCSKTYSSCSYACK